jgi:hypothetical protein
MATEGAGAPQSPFPSLRLRRSPGGWPVWEIPDEEPGTLAEIFAAEDSRRQNLVLYALRDANAFRRSAEVIGKPVDPYELILAVMACISEHLFWPAHFDEHRRWLGEHRPQLRRFAKRLRAAAAAHEKSSEPIWWWWLRLPDGRDLGGIVADLRRLADDIDRRLDDGALKDREGRPRMLAFRRLIRDLASVFERAAGHRAAVTRDHYRPEGYSGRFWGFVEIVRPVAAAIIEQSGAGVLAEPATDLARGKYIEETIRPGRPKEDRAKSKTATEKTHSE